MCVVELQGSHSPAQQVAHPGLTRLGEHACGACRAWYRRQTASCMKQAAAAAAVAATPSKALPGHNTPCCPPCCCCGPLNSSHTQHMLHRGDECLWTSVHKAPKGAHHTPSCKTLGQHHSWSIAWLLKVQATAAAGSSLQYWSCANCPTYILCRQVVPTPCEAEQAPYDRARGCYGRRREHANGSEDNCRDNTAPLWLPMAQHQRQRWRAPRQQPQDTTTATALTPLGTTL